MLTVHPDGERPIEEARITRRMSPSTPIVSGARQHWPSFRLVWLILGLLGGGLAWAAPAGIVFTPEEQAYLARTPSVRMCVDPDWAPFERIDEQGRHIGIGADLVQLVAQRVGLRVELLPTRDWDASLAASKAGRCQLMSFLNQSPARDRWLNFTQPIFYDQNVIITREEHPYIGDPHGLENKTVALPRGTMVEERIRREYPALRIVTTGSEPEAVALVSERKADMTIRSLIVAAYAIKQEGLFNLKISGQMPDFANKLRIGVIKSEPVLRDILDKGVATLTPQEREAIANRHVAVKVEKGIDYTLVWQVTLGGGLIMLVVLYWNRKLRRLNRELERLSITDRLTGLYNRLKLDAVLAAELQRAGRFGQAFSIVLLDLDHFKAVNDRHGHPVGDQVLLALADLLRHHGRRTDSVGRWGGEEFLIICPHTDAAGALTLGENLRQAMRARDFPVVGRQTASFGVTTYQSGDQEKDLLARADAALYEAKRLGRDRVESR